MGRESLSRMFWVCTASAAALASTQVAAQAVPAGDASTEQEAPTQGADDIVVTATKRGEVSLQKVPSAISVVTGAVLDRQNVRALEDVARLTPSLQFAKDGDSDLQLIIRGIQSPGVSTVGFYLDETVINGVNFGSGGGRTPDIGAYDVERVEVLKGPQGTLFGASSMSGTVRIITNKPDAREFGGHVSGTLSGTHEGGTNYGGEGVINIPLVSDVLAVRGVLWHERNGGYIDGYFGVNGATFDKDSNTSEKTGGRIAARFTPTDNFTLDAFYTRQELSVDGPSGDTPEASSGVLAPIKIVSGAPFLRGLVVPPSPNAVAASRTFTDPARPEVTNVVQIYGATAQLDTAIGSFTATASKYDLKYDTSFALTGSGIAFGLVDVALYRATGELQPLGPVRGDQIQDRSVFSSEVRFNSTLDGPFNFVVGGSYIDDRNISEMTVKIADSTTGISLCRSHAECIADVASPGAKSLIYSTGGDDRVRSFALFGNADYEFTDKLKASAGIRYFEARLHNIALTKQAFQGSIPPATPPAYGGPVQTVTTVGLDARDVQSKTTWSGSLSYQIDPDKLVYARAATGFRQGGINNFNSAAQLGIIIPKYFGPDTVLSFEGGAKTSFFDRRLTLNATYFHMFWKDIQVPGSSPTGAAGFISNGTNAKIDGLELEAMVRPDPSFTLSLAATYMTAKLSKDQFMPDLDLFPEPPPLGYKGDRIPKIPKFTLAASMQYRLPAPIIDGVEMSFDAGLSYVGASYNAFNDGFAGFRQIGDYALLNLGINFEAGPATIRIFANNATDTEGAIDWNASITNVAMRSTNRPRTIGVLARYNF